MTDVVEDLAARRQMMPTDTRTRQLNIELRNEWGGGFVYCARHIDRHRPHLFGTITETASDKPCPDCRQEQQHAEAPTIMRAALLSPNFSHRRVRDLMRGYVLCYHYESASPSGFRLACSLDEPRFDAVYNELRAAGLIRSSASPLSPTEPR